MHRPLPCNAHSHATPLDPPGEHVARRGLLAALLGLLLAMPLLNACGDGEESQSTSQQPENCPMERPPGLLLSFDDWSPSWVEQLPLLAKYGAKVTFYISGKFQLDPTVTQTRLAPLVAAGHALGVHTIDHLPESQNYPKDPIGYLQNEVEASRSALEQVENHPVQAFAFPYGDNEATGLVALENRMHHVRGFRSKRVLPFTNEKELCRGGFFLSEDIDTARSVDVSYWETRLDELARTACGVWLVTAHQIVNDAWWGIAPQRLELFLAAAQSRGLQFYRTEDFEEIACDQPLPFARSAGTLIPLVDTPPSAF